MKITHNDRLNINRQFCYVVCKIKVKTIRKSNLFLFKEMISCEICKWLMSTFCYISTSVIL